MTQTTTYQKTFLEKLLGKNYKWWYFLVYVFKLNIAYIFNELLASLNKTLILISSLVIFTYFDQASPELITYLILGNIFFATTDANNSWFLGSQIKEGKLAKILILPQSTFKYLFVNGLATSFYMAITYLISLVPVVLIFWGSLEFNFQNLIHLGYLWIIAVCIRMFLEIITGLSAFWTTEFYGAAFLNTNFLSFFSGSMFPLSFVINNFPAIQYAPWSFVLHHPMQIYLGKYSPEETLLVFAGGIVWCLVLYFIAKLIFKAGLKRNEAVGL